MKILEFANEINAQVLSMPRPDFEISGGYCGDLLSWVMGRADAGQVWITIMTNINIVAVAALADVSAILVAENAEIEDSVVEMAKEQGINILKTELSAFDAALVVGKSCGR